MFKLQEKSNLSTKKIKQLYALPHGRKFKEKVRRRTYRIQFVIQQRIISRGLGRILLMDCA